MLLVKISPRTLVLVGGLHKVPSKLDPTSPNDEYRFSRLEEKMQAAKETKKSSRPCTFAHHHHTTHAQAEREAV